MSVYTLPSSRTRISRTQHWLNRLFYISRAMTYEIQPAEFAELKELLEKLRTQRDPSWGEEP